MPSAAAGQSDERRSTVPDFMCEGVTWQCWIVDDGQRYAWRSTCGRCEVTRSDEGDGFMAIVRGRRRPVPGFQTLRAAMVWAATRGMR